MPTVPEVNFDVQTANELLQCIIEPPELNKNKREEYLLSLVHYGHELKLTVQEFSISQLTKCPKCHQPLTEQ